MEAEVLPPEPIDEEDRVAALVVAVRAGEIAFNLRRVDVQDRPRDVEDVVDLIVVLLLKYRRRSGHSRALEERKELVLEERALVHEPVAEAKVQPEAPTRQTVELRVAHDRQVGLRQHLEDGLLVDLVFVVADEHQIDRHGLLVHDELSGLQGPESIGVGGRGNGENQSGGGEQRVAEA